MACGCAPLTLLILLNCCCSVLLQALPATNARPHSLMSSVLRTTSKQQISNLPLACWLLCLVATRAWHACTCCACALCVHARSA